MEKSCSNCIHRIIPTEPYGYLRIGNTRILVPAALEPTMWCDLKRVPKIIQNSDGKFICTCQYFQGENYAND